MPLVTKPQNFEESTRDMGLKVRYSKLYTKQNNKFIIVAIR